MMNNFIKNIGFSFLFPFFKCVYNNLHHEFPRVKNSEDTLSLLIKSRKSFARYGDGELNLIAGRDIGFQTANDDLKIRLSEIIKTDNSTCYIGIPDIFDNLSRFRYHPKFFWLYTVVKNWRNWKKIIPQNIFLDSLCSRFFLDLRDHDVSFKLLSLWKKIWENRDIVIIEGSNTKMGVGNDLFNNANSIARIICPPTNAYEMYNEILKEALLINKNALIIIALGPTATVLAYDLSIHGYQALDTGHLDLEYNWLLIGAKNKKRVPGRAVNEIHNNIIENLESPEYEKQIIKVISNN